MNETGKCLLAKMSEEHDAEEKVFLGKVVDSFKMKETTQYTVNWFKGMELTRFKKRIVKTGEHFLNRSIKDIKYCGWTCIIGL